MQNRFVSKKSPIFLLFISVQLLLSFVSKAQEILDLSNNTMEGTISIEGTNLNIDTSGLNLIMSKSPSIFINEAEQTVLSIEQKNVSIEDYESVIGQMLRMDSVKRHASLKFKDFTGKLTVGKVNIENTTKFVWFIYLGNSEFVIDIKGFYNENLEPKYAQAFDHCVKSMYINTAKTLSLFDGVPYYFDESKFPYVKDMSIMPLSITMSRQVNDEKRQITMFYFETTAEELDELKSSFNGDTEKIVIDDREIYRNIDKTNTRSILIAFIFRGSEVIKLHCISALNDASAAEEFQDIVRSVKFKE